MGTQTAQYELTAGQIATMLEALHDTFTFYPSLTCKAKAERKDGEPPLPSGAPQELTWELT